MDFKITFPNFEETITINTYEEAVEQFIQRLLNAGFLSSRNLDYRDFGLYKQTPQEHLELYSYLEFEGNNLDSANLPRIEELPIIKLKRFNLRLKEKQNRFLGHCEEMMIAETADKAIRRYIDGFLSYLIDEEITEDKVICEELTEK